MLCYAVLLTSRVSLHIKHLQVCVCIAVGAVNAGGTLVHQHRLVAEVTLNHKQQQQQTIVTQTQCQPNKTVSVCIPATPPSFAH